MKLMRVLRQLLFTAAVVIGIAVTASAQDSKQPPKPPPPKPPPPVVKVPPEKNPPPKDKKPGMAFVNTIWKTEDRV